MVAADSGVLTFFDMSLAGSTRTVDLGRAISFVRANDDGSRILVSRTSSDSEVFVLDDDFEILSRFDLGASIRGVAFGELEPVVYIGDSDNVVKKIDVNGGRTLWSTLVFEHTIEDVKLGPEEGGLFVALANGDILEISVQDGSMEKLGVTGIAGSGDIVVGEDRVIVGYNRVRAAVLEQFEGEPSLGIVVATDWGYRLAFANDQETVVVGRRDLFTYHMEDAIVSNSFREHSRRISDVVIDDGDIAVSGDGNDGVRAWPIHGGGSIYSEADARIYVHSRFVVGGGGETVFLPAMFGGGPYVWRAPEREVTGRVVGSDIDFHAISLGLDGRRMGMVGEGPGVEGLFFLDWDEEFEDFRVFLERGISGDGVTLSKRGETGYSWNVEGETLIVDLNEDREDVVVDFGERLSNSIAYGDDNALLVFADGELVELNPLGEIVRRIETELGTVHDIDSDGMTDSVWLSSVGGFARRISLRESSSRAGEMVVRLFGFHVSIEVAGDGGLVAPVLWESADLVEWKRSESPGEFAEGVWRWLMPISERSKFFSIR